MKIICMPYRLQNNSGFVIVFGANNGQGYRLMKKIAMVWALSITFLLTACTEKTDTAAPAGAEKQAAVTAMNTSSASDHPGKGIHDSNCISCHDTGVYTRADRKVKDYSQLTAQVQRCDANLGAKLSQEDLGKVIDYLNSAFYNFPKS